MRTTSSAVPCALPVLAGCAPAVQPGAEALAATAPGYVFDVAVFGDTPYRRHTDPLHAIRCQPRIRLP
jgi:hypothetical protein